MKILVKLSKSWADEFDCRIFAIMEADSIDSLKAKLTSQAKILEENNVKVWFGTNEYLEPSPGDFNGEGYSCTEFIEISDDEASTINRLLGKCWGTGSSYFDYLHDNKHYI